MTFDILKKEVLNKVDQYYREKEEEFSSFSNNINSDCKRELNEFEKKQIELFERVDREEYLKIVGGAKKQANQIINEAKSFVLEEFKLKLKEKLKNLSKSQREDFFKKIIENLVKENNLEEYSKVISSRKNRDLLNSIFLSYNLKFKFSLQEDLDGFILVGDDNRVKLNVTIDEIVDFIFSKLGEEIVEMLIE